MRDRLEQNDKGKVLEKSSSLVQLLLLLLKRLRARIVKNAWKHCNRPLARLKLVTTVWISIVEKMNNEIDKALKEDGEVMVNGALIRPSSKDVDSLAVHWMVFPGIIKVVKVLEKDKDIDASIGSILKIKNKLCKSIDELLARYISPLSERIEEAHSSIW